MPRGKGGKRQGKPGVVYGNRSDLNSALNKTGPSQVYGQGVAQQRAMQAVPVAPPPTSTPLSSAPTSGGGGGGGPINLPDLFAPTTRPDEPVTSGAPLGPGPGPNSLPIAGDPVVLRLRAIYNLIPNESLRELLEDLEDEF